MRWLLAFVVAGALVAGLAWALWPKPVPVEAVAIGRHDVDITIDDEGKSRVRDVFAVSAPIAGALARINLHAGDAVTGKSSVVASIRPVAPPLLDKRSRRIAETAVDAAKASVDLATAQLRQSEAQASFLKAELDRAENLVHRGAIAERAYDKAVLDSAVAGSDLERAKANLAVQQQQLESAEAVLSQDAAEAGNGACCVDVVAPVSGEVLRVMTESEQVVQPGTPLVEIGDTRDIEITADLLSRDAVRVAPGAKARIDGWGGGPLMAEVVSVSPAAATKVSALGIEEQRVSVTLKLLNGSSSGPRLGHGFRVLVHIVVWHGGKLLTVPVGALFRTGPDWTVYVVKDGVAQLKPVTLGERNDEWAVVASGLEEGERVILHPGDTVANGTQVTATP
ncbi:MAG: efflux RND transporter periplasmic adaptor subunit [Alphaproteobacteria bacterium]|nr:efflux RND transporter periplasmic adaptor subunit [Alphaproteobacteria bacterium]